MPCTKDKAESICSCQTADDVIEAIGWKNVHMWRVFMLTSCVWIVTAPFMMVGAVLSDSICNLEAEPMDSDCAMRLNNSIAYEFNFPKNDRGTFLYWFTTTFMIGNMIGGSIISVISDRYGRRIVLVTSIFFLGLAGILVVVVTSYFQVLVLRLFQGIFFTGASLSAWVLCYESVPSILRMLSTFVFGVTWVIGYCLVAPLAYWILSWRILILIIGAGTVVYSAILGLLLVESFHFLVTKGRKKAVCLWIRHFVGKEVMLLFDVKKLVNTHAAVIGESKSIWTQIYSVIKNRKLVFRISIVSLLWAADVFVYFGMSLFSVQLAGNKYVNYVVIGLVEIPAYVAGPFMLEKIGRRMTLSITHLASAAPFLIAVCFFTENPLIELFLWLISKFSISCAFMCIFVFASELFPTAERNICIGTCSVIGKIIGSAAPFIQLSSILWVHMPLALFGIISAIAGLAALLLPETKDSQLPESTDSIK